MSFGATRWDLPSRLQGCAAPGTDGHILAMQHSDAASYTREASMDGINPAMADCVPFHHNGCWS